MQGLTTLISTRLCAWCQTQSMGVSVRLQLSVILAGLTLAGCAGINVQALTPNGMYPSGQPGLRYYMPRPYLLVTAAPVTPPTQQANTTQPPAQTVPPPAGHHAPAAHDGAAVPPPPSSGALAGAADTAAGDTSKETATTDKTDQTLQPATTGTTDTSYQQVGNGYQIKLVYFPDLGRLMTINQSSGLFGTVSSQPTLVNGWMLSSLQGSADNKVAEVLTAVGGIIGSAMGAPAKSATSKSTTASGAAPPLPTQFPPDSWVLPPGLYGFEYDNISGLITGICSVTLTSNSSPPEQVKSCLTTTKANAAGPWAAVAAH